jgi:hypothetical protein
MASIVSQLRPSLLPRSVSRLFVPQQHSAIHAHGVLTQCCHTAGFRSHVMASVAAAAKTDYVSESKVRSARYTCVYDSLYMLYHIPWLVQVQGSPDSFEFRVFNFTPSKTLVSAWHDVPLYAGNGMINFLCEIPKETSAKMELATDEERNPIKQDTKKGKLRHYPYNINWNYGMMPQTWEDPGHVDAELKAGVRVLCLILFLRTKCSWCVVQ